MTLHEVGKLRAGHVSARTRAGRVRDAGRLEAIEHEAHSHRAFADGSRHPLDRSAADVANAEDTRPTRLEQQRRLLHALQPSYRNRASRQHEAVFVQGELSVEPLGARSGADEDEQSAH